MSAPLAVHPLLRRVFDALDAAGVRWALLRGEARLADPTGDVDLLVAPEDLDRMEAALAPLAVVPVERWGGAHRLFYGYDAGTDRWIELDAEPALDYGPQASFLVNWLLPALRTHAGSGCLARRRQVDGVWVLDPDDAFWTLLLHCIIDKRAVAERHRPRLQELAAVARPASQIGRRVAEASPPGWSSERVIEAAKEGDWDALVALGAEIPRRATARHPVASRANGFAQGVARLGATAARMRRGRGFSVALLGPDGSGKSTLSTGLVEHLGVPARLVYMGLWQGEEGQERSLAQAGLAAARRPLKVWRRYLESRYHRARGRIVIFDRHVYDALLPPEPPMVSAKKVFFGFLAHAAPGPQLTLVLDVPSEVAAQRRPDEDPGRLGRLRDQYLALARRLPHTEVVPAEGTPDEVRIEATNRIWQAYARRRSGKGPDGSPDESPDGSTYGGPGGSPGGSTHDSTGGEA